MRELKRRGFSDRRLAFLLDTTEAEVRKLRHQMNVRPVYKRVDTCAAEFATTTAYMYSTYETGALGQIRQPIARQGQMARDVDMRCTDLVARRQIRQRQRHLHITRHDLQYQRIKAAQGLPQ